MKTKNIVATIVAVIMAVVVLAAQQWDQVNGSMQLRANTGTQPLMIVDQRGTGKIASFRYQGTETFSFGGTSGSQILAPDGTSSVPPYSFASEPGTGMYWVQAGVIGFDISGSGNVVTIQATGYNVGNGLGIRNSAVGTKIVFPAVNGNITLLDNAGTNFGLLQLGGTTSAFPAWARNGTAIEAKLADGSGTYTSIKGGQLRGNTAYALGASDVIFVSATAPTVPVACTSPTVTWNNGTAAFQIDVGTTCAGISTLSMTMPASTNAWVCYAVNTTTSTTAEVEMTASTSTSATFTNYTRTTGVALTWVDGADIRIGCLGG